MGEIEYSDEQREALTAANLATNRVPLYYRHGRLSGGAIEGLTILGLVTHPSPNRLLLTDLGREEAQRLLAADVAPGF